MFIAIDLKRMAVIYRCEKLETLRALCTIEVSHMNIAIMEESNIAAYRRFVCDNLHKLYRNLTNDVNPHSNDNLYLAREISKLCQTVPTTTVNDFEVYVQASHLKPQDKNYYRYVKGGSVAKEIENPYYPPPLIGNWKAAQGLPAQPVQTAQPAPAKPVPVVQSWGVAPCATVQTSPPKYAPPWL